MEHENKEYIDEWDNSHTLRKEISRGGQGVLYSTTDKEIVVKISFNNDNKKDKSTEKTKYTQFKIFSTLEKIDVTFPISNLTDISGYTMRLLNDMVSFDSFFDVKKNKDYTNDWLEEIGESTSKLFGNYIATGGAKLRLIAFLKVAINIAKLHSLGLVYCDISENNIFITNGEIINMLDKFNVSLIDCDNIDFKAKTQRNVYYTRSYGAPEVVADKGCNFASDCYALMIAIFWQVTNTHPFKGKLIEDNFSPDEDNIYEEKLNQGLLPWLLDKEDTSNAFEDNIYQTNIPYDIVFSDDMLRLFDDTFSLKGRTKPITRPTIYKIVQQLYHEVIATLKCNNCEMDFNYFKHTNCPYCDNVSDNIILIKSSKGTKQVVSLNDNNYIKKSIITNDIYNDFLNDAFKISFNKTTKLTTITNLTSFNKFNIDGVNVFGSIETPNKIIKLEVTDEIDYELEIEVFFNND